MYRYIVRLISGFFFLVASTHAMAEVIDPEMYIQKNGYQSEKLGEDGKTKFYSFTEGNADLFGPTPMVDCCVCY